MKSIQKCVADSIVNELLRIHHEDASKNVFFAEPVNLGSTTLVVGLNKVAMAWWADIKIIAKNKVLETENFICGGANGPIRFDAIIEAVRDKVTPYLQ